MEPQVDALKDFYRVITIDLRGHGESDTLLWNDTLDDYAADVIDLLDELGFLKQYLSAYRWVDMCSFRSIEIMLTE